MRGGDADALAEERQSDDRSALLSSGSSVAQDLEHGERAPQQRIVRTTGLDHDELARRTVDAISGAPSAMTL